MIPGKNFGIVDKKLITRIAFVDFDGRKAWSFIKKIDSYKMKILLNYFQEFVMEF